MVHLDDANILDNLRKRYQKDEIYTFTANVLLAVNPYKSLPGFYTKEQMAKYRGKNQGTLPPHPYAIADVAYRQMLRDRKNQALVISGESGAGKTETAKITMHYMTSVSRTDAAQGSRIQEKIINANPILESFGNATTVMNQNSSRFGKYNEMMFNPVGSLVGAGMKTFLLETSRVVSQQQNEKNYHVFYEMLAGMDEEVLDGLMLHRTEHYKLLHSAGAQPLQEGSQEARRLALKFEELKKALSSFVDEDVENEVWSTLGALVHLGEVDFVEVGASSQGDADCDMAMADASPSASPSSQEPKVEVANVDALDTAADLLGLPYTGLAKLLKWKEMHVHRHHRTSHILCPRSLAQARQTLQCVIKILYRRLFDKIVCKINEASLNPDRADQSYNSIGTLDIYGFERLETNSFEQLCINLANERLQQFFVEEVLGAEQRMYAEERLNIAPMELPDSTPVVSNIKCVMAKLDEHSLRSQKNLVRIGAGEDKDQKFCQLVHRELIKDTRQTGPIMALKLKANRSGEGLGLHDGFQIRHYAGCVSYSTKGWIDKNNDSLVPEIEALLADGKKKMVREMSDSKGIGAVSGERLQSVSSNYLTNLDDLLNTLKQCSVHYIRCFNPNQNRQAGVFDAKYVLDQVIQCGTVELVKIMHHGYPHRCFLKDLRDRFKGLLPPEFARYTDRDFLHAVMLAWEIDESQWTLGTRRLFLKAGQLRALEDLRDLGTQASQAVLRKIRFKFRMKKVRAFAYAVEFATYVQKEVKTGKRERFFRSFIKAMNICVRLCRWLRKARTNLYGILPEDDTMEVQRRETLHKLGLACPLELADRPKSNLAKLFTAPNGADETSESVLYFDGSSLKSVQLNQKAFLPHTDGLTGRALQDLRHVDCMSSGQALRLGSAEALEPIWRVCQHPGDRQLFAVCNDKEDVLVWKWLGTSPNDLHKPAVAPEAFFTHNRSQQILQMSFLSKVPQKVADENGVVLAVLSIERRGLYPLLLISVYRIIQSFYCLDCIVNVHFGNDNHLDYIKEHGVHISHFGTTASGSGLVVAGDRILRCFTVGEDAKGRVTLASQENVDSVFFYHLLNFDLGRDCGGSVTSVCHTPMTGRDEEWMWVGMSSGELLGVRFALTDSGLDVHDKSSGRYRASTHTKGLPIQVITPVYFPDGKIRTPFSQVTPNMDQFLSIGADGKLVVSMRNSNSEWQRKKEDTIGDSHGVTSMGRPEIVAGSSSVLVPSALLVVDEGRRCIMATDWSQPDCFQTAHKCSLE